MAGPHCLRLIDTAGLNPAPAPLEKLGIEKTLERADEADLFLLVLDATQPAPVLPPALASRISNSPTIVVLNKTDLVGGAPVPLPSAGSPAVPVSALTGAGLEALTAAITRLADAFRGDTGDELIAINARHAHALGRARENLQAAQAKLGANEPVELLASDLRGVLDALGEISGKVDNERMLDRLFAAFCIGK